MNEPSIRAAALRRMTAPTDYFIGTGQARPISVRNVVAFCRTKSRELGDRKNLHHRFVLCCNLRDSSPLQLVLNTVAHRLAPGSYTLLFPHQLHAFADLSERDIATVFITFETSDEDMLLHLHSRIFVMVPQVESAIAAFIEEYSGIRGPRNEKLAVLSVQTLLETIIMHDRDSGVEASVTVPSALKDAMLRLTGDRIPTAGSVAREAGLSEAYLRKLFKRHLGISLGRYLVEMRQNKARSLLGASEESVSSIAELCGYKSIYAFSRSFRAYNNCTPTGYRERHRASRRQLAPDEASRPSRRSAIEG